ncbi:MAG: LysM peptidoglycan-binding domain-containing protein [bacterium]|nr:LysM peptidoglycan-binding domain-containing protein [bacterium]
MILKHSPHPSATRWMKAALAASALLFTAGCFRPASEAVQTETIPTTTPVSSGQTVDPAPAVTLESLPAEATQDSSFTILPTLTPSPEALDSFALTPTIPIIEPTVFQSQPTLTPSRDAQSIATATPENFAFSGTPTIRFITPGSPLGFITPDPVLPGTLVLPTLTSTPGLSEGGAAASGGGSTAIPTVTPQDACVYVVQAGDTLFQIAIDQDVAVNDIRTSNPELTGQNPILQIGQELIMPRENCPGYIPPPPQAETDPAATDDPAATRTRASSAAEGAGEVYTVQPGDTLFTIAQRFGTTISAIVEANELTNPDQLRIGQELIIPNDE